MKVKPLRLCVSAVLLGVFSACGQFTGNAPRLRTNDVAATDNRVPLTNLSSVGATSGQIPVATNGNSIVWRDAPSGGSLDTNQVISLIQSNTIAIDTLASAGQTNLLGVGPSTNPIPIIVGSGLSLDNSGNLTALGSPQTPYTSDHNAAGHSVTNAGTLGGTNLVIIGTGVNTMDNVAITNLTLITTNAAPTGITWGTTAPDVWFKVTNAGVQYFMPGFKNH